MIRNRAFQMNDTGGAPDLSHYSSVNSDGSSSSINLDSTVPLNDVLTHTLRLDVSKVASGGRVGFSNEGFWGIRVQPKETYNASFYVKSNKYTGPLTVSLESSSGKVLASATVPSISSNFTQYSVNLKPSVTQVSTDNVFVISTSSSSAAGSSIWFDVISLFPPTYKNRKNGLRADLGQILADTKPSFFRFPGGNNIEGQTIQTRWKWNETIGKKSYKTKVCNDEN
jgi:alpha-N-arabinofuranosidase